MNSVHLDSSRHFSLQPLMPKFSSKIPSVPADEIRAEAKLMQVPPWMRPSALIFSCW